LGSGRHGWPGLRRGRICEYGGKLEHASSFPNGTFPTGAKGNTHTRGVATMFSRLNAKNLKPEDADGKLASPASKFGI